MARIKKIWKEIVSIVNANNIILTYPDVKAQPHRVNLLNYNVEKSGQRHYNDNPYNLGDELGKIVIDWMLANYKGGVITRDSWVRKKKFFVSVGSAVLSSYQDATFWGTGVMYEYSAYRAFFHRRWFRKLDFRAVRGPLSREYVMKLGHMCPEIYGDPAILMPMIYQPAVEKQHDYAIIPQYVTEGNVRQNYPDNFIISMNTNDFKTVIDQIASCKKIITSSLHGIILAEAYGVPAVWYRGLVEKVNFKYKDYYYSTGRHDIPMLTTIEEALAAEPLPIPDLSTLQQGLMKSFPYDLWEQE